MTLFEGVAGGLAQAMSFGTLPFLALGALFGLVVGLIPGLSGHFAMAMAVTFLYSMEPSAGVVFMLAAHATVAQGGGLTAILFSTPGTGQNAATLLDGPKMRDKGQAGIAVGAAMTACFLGASFGAVVLMLLVPVLREVVLFFGPPEIFALASMGLIFVAAVGGRDLVRSLIAGLFGLLLAMVGVDNASNLERFTFGSSHLADGLSLAPVVLGLFAVAEMIAIWRRGGALAGDAVRPMGMAETQRQILQGVLITLRKWRLVLRCSAIGTVIGVIPGVGSAPAAFVAYGHARQSARDPETFGTGDVEGVIAPEAANDAVEGGALASTIAFGIPGSSSMAILLSGLAILGLETGPRMLNENLDLVFLMSFTIVLGNLLGTVGGMFLVNPLVRATAIRATVMVPILLAVIVSGAYAGDRTLFDVGVALVFGAFGYTISLLRYSRAALLIGFVLGDPFEYNLNLAVQLDGPLFLLQPIPLVLISITAVFLGRSILLAVRARRSLNSGSARKPQPEEIADRDLRGGLLTLEIAFLALISVAAGAALIEALDYDSARGATPFAILAPLTFLILLQAARTWRFRGDIQVFDTLRRALAGALPGLNAVVRVIGGLALLFGAIAIFGHYVGLLSFVVALMRLAGKESLRLSMGVGLIATALIYIGFEYVLDVEMYRGLLFRYLVGYRAF